MKLKDKKIEILRRVDGGVNSMGERVQGFEPIAPPLWAYFRHLSGNEIMQAGVYEAVENVLFTINYRPDVTPQHAVKYRGKVYEITRIDTFEGYKEDITLYCTLQGDG